MARLGVLFSAPALDLSGDQAFAITNVPERAFGGTSKDSDRIVLACGGSTNCIEPAGGDRVILASGGSTNCIETAGDDRVILACGGGTNCIEYADEVELSLLAAAWRRRFGTDQHRSV